MSLEAGRCGMHPYRKDIRVTVFSLFDYAFQVRHLGLTVFDSDKLEGIQKRAMTIAFPELSYECAVNRTSIPYTPEVKSCFDVPSGVYCPPHTQSASSIAFSRVLSHNFENKTKIPARTKR